jgi:hypothetical protein
MSHGIQVFNANGSLGYSTADVTWNQVDFFRVEGFSSAQRDYPVIVGREVLLLQILINPPPVDRRAVAHSLAAVGATVTASGGSEASYILVLMR